ncbi:MAG: hypothetical protein JXR43_06125 [Burkholderiaceae bacterium]|nr:hypothetical protein [Burkholderiaceae bacterium]
MKPMPPNHIVLPVLTERLQPDDESAEHIVVAPFETQPSAYANAVYRGPELVQSLAGEMADAPAIDLDRLWAHLAPGLQQQLLERIRAEFDALAPQVAANLFQSLEQTLRASLADAVKPQ